MSLADLAGYASSDESEDEQASQETSLSKSGPTGEPAPSTTTLAGVDSIVDEDDEEYLGAQVATDVPGPSVFLFSSLPAPEKPGAGETMPEAEDVIEASIPKPTKRQIHIPKLSELEAEDDDDEPKAKKKVIKSSAGSGLLKMLPPPATVPVAKGSVTKLTQLTPHSVGKKPPPPKPKPKPQVKPKPVSPAPDALPDEDDNDEAPSNFFSFEEPKLSEEQLKSLITAEDLKPREKRPPSPDVGPVIPGVPEPELEPEPLPAVSASGSQDIPEEALVQLRGRRREKIEIFSIDAADFTAEARSNLSKNLTVEDTRPAPSEGSDLSRLHKSKHHITHLAFQAKARENELKNQWASNRMTKRETQRKYGF